MKSTLPILTLAIAFTSCTTAYKSGQTPDDVYFSPARPQAEYVQSERNDDREYRYDEGAYRDDRYLRMKIRDHRYAGLYDDYYSYNPYYYHYYNGYLVYNSPFSPTGYWDYYYSPYHGSVVTCVPKSVVSGRPRVFDLNVYNPPPSGNSKLPKVYTSSTHGYNPGYEAPKSNSNDNNYRSSGSNAGNFLRDVFGGSGSSNSSSSGSKGSSSSSSSPSSSGSSGSTNAPARRF